MDNNDNIKKDINGNPLPKMYQTTPEEEAAKKKKTLKIVAVLLVVLLIGGVILYSTVDIEKFIAEEAAKEAETEE